GDANVIATALEGVPTPISEELLSCLQDGNYSAYYATLKKHPLVDPATVAAIGYCFGGGTVLELARSGAELSGVVSFHLHPLT
ncbi:dienelactone hydrolase family protein, partial [Acetomicrobium sp. S15 = DSM 107314]|uniref:dienelactone hydrolase family protein n=1 Tax=Acetomicrobium sp. S15 = DSM 107314 TaxID=2529858 RepID=UPI001E46CEB8